MNIRSLLVTGLLAIALAACGAQGGNSPTTPITERDFKFDTPEVTVQSGSTLAVTNAGPTVHNLAIRDAAGAVVATTSDLKPGATESLIVDVPAGTYAMFCTLPGHESLGLRGTLTVASR